MSVPKKRAASRARKTRAAHHALSKVSTVSCAQCKKVIQPHSACPHCGNYKGRNVFAKVNTAAKPAKKTAGKPTAKTTEPSAADKSVKAEKKPTKGN